MNRYNNDIQYFIGHIDDKIVFQTASENGWLKLDIIDKNFNLYTCFAIEHSDFKHTLVMNNKLILICENDDDGIYLNVYDITLN